MTAAQIEHNAETYNTAAWGEGYVGINNKGRVEIYPRRRSGGPTIELFELARLAQQQGLRLPVLFRFGGIIHDRVQALYRAFGQAISENHYQGEYTAVYPIKVNQQRMVVEDVLAGADGRVGLEAGSKPELMAVLALSSPGGTIVCNGYKDRRYIRLALIGRRLGFRIYIVIEKLSEIPLVLREAEALDITPLLGIRVRLSSITPGKWQDTGGEKSKFGLSTAQLLRAVEMLRRSGHLENLQLLHFHLGSQVANIMDIQRGLSEAVRALVELDAMGTNIRVMNVGGGLGVDYEGTRSRSECSINYTLEQYANTIVRGIAEACIENDIEMPDIVTESGRAMTAHHAVIVTNIIDRETAELEPPPEPDDNDPLVISDLWKCLVSGDEHPGREVYQDAKHWMDEIQSMYVHGVLNLQQRARAERIFAAVCRKISTQLRPTSRTNREIIDELNEKQADKYFCNLSIFQSLPDIWAIQQIFPIMPLHRLDEVPDRRVTLQDLTCDSDGRIQSYVDGENIESTLPLHALKDGEDYLIGIFLVGAYQEILGDVHNLFGDTDSVNVDVDEQDNLRLKLPERGDSAGELLQHVHYNHDRLIERYHQLTKRAGLVEQQERIFLDELEAGLSGYTYLEK